MDRFRGLLKERENELRVSDDEEDLPPLSAEDIMQLYDLVLSDLNTNSKPLINELTVIAEQRIDYAEAIVDVICNRIIEVTIAQKLPSLYLLDSIVKNIGGVYVRYFASRLHEVFCEAYRQVHPNLYAAMRHLFGTWSAVFPPEILRRIGTELQLPAYSNHESSGSIAFSSSDSMSRRPTHGIHVNPKYLEPRHQSEQATVDQLGRRISSSQQIHDTNNDFGYAEDDIDHSEKIYPQARGGKLGLPGLSACTSSIGGDERIHPLKTRVLSPSKNSHGRTLSPSFNRFGTDSSPERAVRRASPSQYELDYGHRRTSERDGERTDWWMKHGSNLDDQQRPRALIDAYGSHREKSTLRSEAPNVEQLDANYGSSGASTKSWKNTEEEEYVWEEMSPTLADHSKSEDPMSFNPSLGSLKARSALGRPTAARTESDMRRCSWPSQSQRSVLDVFPSTAEDEISNLGPGTSSMGKKSVVDYQTPNVGSQIQGPLYSQERWSLSSHNSQSSQHNNRDVGGRAGQMPPAALAPSSGQKMPYSIYNSNNNLKHHALSQKHLCKPEDSREGFIPSISAHVSSQLAAQPSNHGHTPQGYGSFASTHSLNQIPFPSLPIQNMTNITSLQSGGVFPRPIGPPPAVKLRPASQNMGLHPPCPPVSTGFGGLINSLMAKGLISLTTIPAQDSVGVEFDTEVLKVRHESAIKALYNDLPRQCTTCGLRFKCQEEHSSHMDWHVTKNRMSRNRKQQPSRKWFVSTTLWLSGAETVGNDAVPGFTMPTEVVIAKKDDDEMAVPADEDQNSCALCGELFDDFYSDETEEWMYKGAVYLNAPDGSAQGLDRSLLGPIVHAKCRSGSSVISSEALVQNELERIDEGSERKRMRV